MWIVWLERNCHSFENMEKTLDELKVLCQHSLFEWARCSGFTDTLSLSEFMFSLRLSFWFPYLLFWCLVFLFLVVHRHELLVLFFFLIYNNSLITYQKKKVNHLADVIKSHINKYGICELLEKKLWWFVHRSTKPYFLPWDFFQKISFHYLFIQF